MSDLKAKYMEKAREVSERAKAECAEQKLFLATGNALDVFDHHIAAALASAHQDGMKQAAEIARGMEGGVAKPADGAIQTMLRGFGNEVRKVTVGQVVKAILSEAER